MQSRPHRTLLVLAALAAAMVLSAPPIAAADSRWRIDLENGAVFSGYNDVAIPGDTGTRFSLSRDF